MNTFQCTCQHQPILFFENTSCMSCGRLTGFSEKLRRVVPFNVSERQDYFICDSDQNRFYRKCSNFSQHGVCNGMLCEEEMENNEQGLCFYCHYNHSIPDLSIPGNIAHWRKLETAKRRTLYTLQQLSLPIPDRNQDPANGLVFHFLADKKSDDHFREPLQNQATVYTGHNAGEITINLSEADDVARNRAKVSMNEQYRTLLGHFRHEIGHYYWDHLVATNETNLALFRENFGDEGLDYQQALQAHYDQGAGNIWPQQFITAYASAHPWEDWAETWAHYLHMIDTLETAKCFGVELNNAETKTTTTDINHLQLPQESHDSSKDSIESILNTWLRFSVMFNSLNRSMGLHDAYPFVISDSVRNKIQVVHHIVHTKTN